MKKKKQFSFEFDTFVLLTWNKKNSQDILSPTLRRIFLICTYLNFKFGSICIWLRSFAYAKCAQYIDNTFTFNYKK